MSKAVIQQALDGYKKILEEPKNTFSDSKVLREIIRITQHHIASLERELAKPEQENECNPYDLCAGCRCAYSRLAQPEQDAGKCGCGANLYIDENGKPCSKAQPEFDTPESHIVGWSIPVDPNNFGEALAQPEQKLDYPPECTTPEMELAYAAGWWKALEVQRQQALDKKSTNARELGLDYEPEQEPFEYWNAVEGWVKIDEIRKHFEMVGCGTIYKTGGEGRKPLYTTPPKREWVGLTDDEIDTHAQQEGFASGKSPKWFAEMCRAIEAKLREKNGRTDSHTGGGATGSGRAWASGGVDDHDPI